MPLPGLQNWDVTLLIPTGAPAGLQFLAEFCNILDINN
jgi:hypothetical protein